jgi:hypothetical protein
VSSIHEKYTARHMIFGSGICWGIREKPYTLETSGLLEFVRKVRESLSEWELQFRESVTFMKGLW